MDFRTKLTRFFNGDLIWFEDKFLYLGGRRLYLSINSKRLWKEKVNIPLDNNGSVKSGSNYYIPDYDGKNKWIYMIGQQLDAEIKDNLIGAYVHGSFADGTENKYSDFDGLVILKDKVLNLPDCMKKTAASLINARKIMHKIDHLQHHGWFIIMESELKNFPTNYFPLEIFKHTKSLIRNFGNNLTIWSGSSSTELQKFSTFSDNVINMGREKRTFENIYLFKSYLSQIMLLPAIYYQSKTGKGVYKKESFKEVKMDFPSTSWKIMDEVSNLRLQWDYELFSTEQWLLRHSYNPLIRHWVKNKKLGFRSIKGMKIPKDFSIKIEELVDEMQYHLTLSQ